MVRIQVFSPSYRLNISADWDLQLQLVSSLKDGQLWIQMSATWICCVQILCKRKAYRFQQQKVDGLNQYWVFSLISIIDSWFYVGYLLISLWSLYPKILNFNFVSSPITLDCFPKLHSCFWVNCYLFFQETCCFLQTIYLMKPNCFWWLLLKIVVSSIKAKNIVWK